MHGSEHFTTSAAEDGEVQWDCETMRSFQSIATHQRQSGSISRRGAMVHARHPLFNSRGGLYFHEPDNMLLVVSSEQQLQLVLINPGVSS